MRTALRLSLLGAWWLGAPGDASADRSRDEILISGMTFVSSESAGRHWVVWAEQTRFETGSEVALLDGVTIRFSDPGEQIDLTIRCSRARFVVDSESFRLDGDVRGEDSGGRRFVTDWLEFDGASRVLSTSAPVELIDAGSEYRGGGMRYDVETRRLLLSDGASMRRGGGS
jgi:LPS export ABC transporter protein LptC